MKYKTYKIFHKGDVIQELRSVSKKDVLNYIRDTYKGESYYVKDGNTVSRIGYKIKDFKIEEGN